MTALLGCCCITYELASLLKSWSRLRLWHLGSKLMTLGVLVKARPLRFLQALRLLTSSSVTLSFVPARVGRSSPEPWRVPFCSLFWLMRVSLCISVLLREPVGCCLSRWFRRALLPKPFTARPALTSLSPRLLLLALFASWIPSPPCNNSDSLSLFM